MTLAIILGAFWLAAVLETIALCVTASRSDDQASRLFKDLP